ncbi:Protein-lysine methyltransferase METTL21D [Lamellibrachia satsuma]|nr:Protein-lysine methyltransferase METTL21D [Lamellibrachia satsuma]
MPTVGLGALPTVGLGTLPAVGLGALPTVGLGAMPTVGLGALLTVGLGALPTVGLGTMPTVGLGALPTVGLGALPTVGLGTLPAVGLGALPTVGLGTLPTVGLGTMPTVGLGTLPTVGLGALPTVGQCTLPTVGLGVLHTVGLGVLPAVGLVSTPAPTATSSRLTVQLQRQRFKTKSPPSFRAVAMPYSECYCTTGKRVVELGAGTGLVGLQAACLGAFCTITDLPEFVPLMQLNIDANIHLVRTGSIITQALKWGGDVSSFLPPPDYILLADCIYYTQSLEPLVDTIVNLSSSKTTILCCYEERTTGNKPQLEKDFFKLINEGFTVEEIAQSRQHAVYHSPDIHIIKFTKR